MSGSVCMYECACICVIGLQGYIQKMGLEGKTVTFQIVGGQWCNHEPMAYNKLRGFVDMFPKEIF